MATTRFDTAEYLAEPDAQAEFLAARLEDGAADEIRSAINTIARARGMSDLAKATGIRREQLYRALGEDGNPEFATILKVLRALGVTITAAPPKDARKNPLKDPSKPAAPKRKSAKKTVRRVA